jgi:CHAT domain-containing protein
MLARYLLSVVVLNCFFAVAAVAADEVDKANPSSRFSFLMHEAARADSVGDAGKRLTLLREAAALEVPNNDERTLMYQHLGSAEAAAGNLREALVAREAAAKMAWLIDKPGKQVIALTQGVSLQLKLGDTAGAKKSLAAAERVSFPHGRRGQEYRSKWVGSLEQARGRIAQAEGRYADAEASFQRSLSAFEDYRMRGAKFGSDNEVLLEDESAERLVENALGNLVEILKRQGRLAEAELFARQLLVRAKARQGEPSFAAGHAHRIMSALLAARGRYTEAEGEAKLAVADLQAVGVLPYAMNMVRSQQALAVALAGQEKWQEAASVFQAARAVLNADPELAQKFQLGNLHWALTLIQVGKSEQAIPMLQKILAKQLSLQPDTAIQPALTRGLLGLAQYTAGQVEVAETSFRFAVPILLENLQQLDAENQGVSATELMIRKVMDAYIGLLMTQRAERPSSSGEDTVDLAFRYADMSAASTVSRALAQNAARSMMGSVDTRLADMVREEQNFSQRISQLSQTLEGLTEMRDAKLVQSNIDALRSEIEKARKSRTKLHQDILRSFPQYASLINPHTPDMSKIAQLLRPNEVLLSIHPADRHTYVWAIRAGQQPAYAIVDLSRYDLAALVKKLRLALDPGAVSLSNTPAFDIDTAHQLYRRLLGPLEKSLAGADHLLVVSPGALGQIPLGVLVTGKPVLSGAKESQILFAEYRNVPWLINRYAITNLPTVMNFATLRMNRTPAAKLAFAGFGDPLFSTQQTVAGKKRGANSVRALKLVKSDAADSWDAKQSMQSDLAFLPQLPETRDEILAIARVLQADMTRDVFLGAAANEANVRRAQLEDRRVIAFSTHGLVPGEISGLGSPALALSAPELATIHDQDDNGFLTIEKVLSLKLNAEWVILSACNTASGDGVGAEAFSGLGRAFFYAGARSLLLSHWPVESYATEKLITSALSEYSLNPTAGRAKALRQAELVLMNSQSKDEAGLQYSFAHPLFWAAFSLVGEGGAQQ